MSYKVSLDAGHGMNTGGKRTPKLKKDLIVDGKVVKKKGQIIHEFEFNILVAKSLKKALERCGVQVKIVNDETGKTDTPLATRANRANAYGSDLHISCHYNAIGSCASFQNRCHGVLVLKTKGCQSKSSKLADCVHNAIKGNYSHTYGVGIDVKWSGFTLAILRRTKMPAILIEYGFMDYEDEAMKMLEPSWYTKLAEDTCKGVCDYLGIKYKKPSTKDTNDKKKGEGAVKRIDVKDFVVRIKTDSLNVRKGPGTKFDQVVEDGKKLVVKKGGAYTITHVNATKTWGYLKSGAGWICITDNYVEKIWTSQNIFKGCVITEYGTWDGSTDVGCTGKKLTLNKSCASHNLPVGTKVYIKALKGVVNDNGIFIVEDTGGHCFDFDIFTSEPKFGKKLLDVEVLEFGKGKITASYTTMCKYFIKNGIFDKFKVSWEFYKKNGKLIKFLKFNNEDKDIKKQPWY